MVYFRGIIPKWPNFSGRGWVRWRWEALFQVRKLLLFAQIYKWGIVHCLVWWHRRGMSHLRHKDTNRRKFRSQTSDAMDRWKSTGGKSQRREEKKKEDQRRERVRRKKMQVREKVAKLRNTVFFQWFVAPEGRKVGSLKQRVRRKANSKSKCAKHTRFGAFL